MKHAKKQTKTTGASASGKRSKTSAARAAKRTTRTRDPRLPAPGTVLKRTFKGEDLRVTVLDEGCRFEGETFRSLTAAALRATGYTHISGPHFWKTDAPPATTKRATKKVAATSVATPTTAPAETPTT